MATTAAVLNFLLIVKFTANMAVVLHFCMFKTLLLYICEAWKIWLSGKILESKLKNSRFETCHLLKLTCLLNTKYFATELTIYLFKHEESRN